MVCLNSCNLGKVELMPMQSVAVSVSLGTIVIKYRGKGGGGLVKFIFNVAKCNLGKVNLESMRPAVFPTNTHAGWPQGFALPCADESALFAICSSFAIIVVFLHCFTSKFTTLPFPPLLQVRPR